MTHKLVCLWLSRFFKYINPNYSPSIEVTWTTCFLSQLDGEASIEVVIVMIELELFGQSINMELVKTFLQFLGEFDEVLGLKEMFYNKKMFEKRLLENACNDYCDKVLDCIDTGTYFRLPPHDAYGFSSILPPYEFL
ncbi:hypothetical protein LINGRAHAP2_LOCUS18661 [Linum grandiflorum]